MVVAASATEDGRPLLFKNRDNSSSYMVEMSVRNGDGYKYIAQFAFRNGVQTGPWGGFNEKGFCIVNSVSYNLTELTNVSQNSMVLEKALCECVNTSDFEEIIERQESTMDIRANYGVIDAQGHAVLYEVGPNGYTKYDANDEHVAPEGIIIRTNYSLMGDVDQKAGKDRLIVAQRFVKEAKFHHQLSGRYILQNLPRYLINSSGISLYDSAPVTWNDETKASFDGYIPRYSSTSAMLIQGVRKNDNSSLTMSWAMVGPPMTTVAVPLFLTPNNILPEKVIASHGSAWLCRKGQMLKKVLFPYDDKNIIDLSKLYNYEQTGIMQQILEIENEIISRGIRMTEEAYTRGYVIEEKLMDYYAWLNSYLKYQYENYFNRIETSVTSLTNRPMRSDGMWDISGKFLKDVSNYQGIIIKERKKMVKHINK